MTQSLALSLRQLAQTQPNVAHAVATLGLDYREYPDMLLEDALNQLGLPPDLGSLFGHISLWRLPCDVCWPSTSIDGIISHILEQHHRFLRNELPRLELLLNRALHREPASSCPNASELFHTFLTLKAEIDVHLLKEEETLFPLAHAIERAQAPFHCHCGTVLNPISIMMTEHDNAKSALAEIRRITRDFAPSQVPEPLTKVIYSALRQFEADLLAHIREEDDILFPRIIALEDELFNR